MNDKDLTIKQRKFIKYYLELGNATEAVIKAGYDVKDNESAAQIGYENLRKLDYEDFMEAAGITDDLLQKKIIEGLDSMKQIGALVLISGDKPMKTKDNEGQIEVPDYAIRHKYLETALKLKKRLIERIQHSGDVDNPISVDINATLNKIYGQKDSSITGEVHNTGKK